MKFSGIDLSCLFRAGFKCGRIIIRCPSIAYMHLQYCNNNKVYPYLLLCHVKYMNLNTKNEFINFQWWGAGVVVCLEQGADNSMIYT